MSEEIKVPFYKSTKKTLGVLFAVAVLVGGMYGIYKDPSETVDVLQVWGLLSGAYLGIKTVGGAIMNKGSGK